MLATISMVLVLLLSGCGDTTKSPAEARKAMAVEMTHGSWTLSTDGKDNEILRIESPKFGVGDEIVTAAFVAKFKRDDLVYNGKSMCAMGFKEVDMLEPQFVGPAYSDVPKTVYKITLPCEAR